MGDCWIKIVFSSELLLEGEKTQEGINNNEGVTTTTTATTTTSTKKYSSDTTIREVVQGNNTLWSLFSSTTTTKKNLLFKLWDCTVHPPKDISSWPMIDFPELTGPKSKTLHDAGCFPSGTWLVLPYDVHPSQFSTADYDDVQYNKRTKTISAPGDNSTTTTTTTLLEFAEDDRSSSTNKASRPLPSEVMGSVTKRFEKEENETTNNQDDAIRLRIQNQAQQRQKELDRARKLDERIRKLEETTSTGKKNKSVSNQVRKMLVKSRAIGDKNLKMQDRIYFECMVDIDDGASSSSSSSSLTRHFAYFSPQATFASIATFFASTRTKQQEDSCMNSEVIIKRRKDRVAVDDDDDDTYYRRFPVTMRVYEAIENKYLTSDQVDTIVIRWYPDGHTSTPSILDENDKTALAENDDDVAMGDSTTIDPSTVTKPSSVDETAAAGQIPNDGDGDGDGTTIIQDSGLSTAIRVMEESSAKKGAKKPKKKPLSASAMKVRNMQMKAKAKGDKKRIPKVEDRFFLEVVLVDDTGKPSTADPYFLARTDPIQRLLSNVTAIEKDPTNKEWEFLIPQQKQQTAEDDNNQYRVIHDTMMILKDAEIAGILNCFDRIILRPV